MLTSPTQTPSKPSLKAPSHLFPSHLFSIFQTTNSLCKDPTIPLTHLQLQKRYHSLRNIQKYTSKVHVYPRKGLSRKSLLGIKGLRKLQCDISAAEKSTKKLLLPLAKTLQNNPSLTTISLKISFSELLKLPTLHKLIRSLCKIPKLKHLSVFLEGTKDSIVESLAKNLKGLKGLETFEIRTSWQVYSSPFNSIHDQCPPLSDIGGLLSGFSSLKSLTIAFDLCARITGPSIQDFVLGIKPLKNLKELEVSFDYCWFGAQQKPKAFDFMCICGGIGDFTGLRKLGLKFSTWKVDDFQFDFLTDKIERLKSLATIDLKFGPQGISYESLKRQMMVFSRMAGLSWLKLDYPVEKNEVMERLLMCLRPEQRRNAEVLWPEERRLGKREKNITCSLF